MFRKLIVFSSGISGGEADNMARFAEITGIEQVKRLKISCSSWPQMKELMCGERVCIIAIASELFKIIHFNNDLEWFKTFLLEKDTYFFLYGFSGSPEESEILQELTGGSVTALLPLKEGVRVYGVDLDCPLTKQRFRGKNFSIREKSKSMCFLFCGESKGVNVLMTADGLPFYLWLMIGKSRLFLAGFSQVENIDYPVRRETPLFSFVPSLVPAIMFLREAFREECWHNPFPKACFIIDDPSLKMDYGFLNYQNLLKILKQKEMTASIAFIPWNWRKTRKEVAGLFLANPERYSLAIHGCDHTWAEFGGSNGNALLKKSNEAILRMEKHREVAKIPFDRIMVFPQGIFSARAMEALESAGYCAAVNSTPYPVEASEEPLALSDLLDGAILKYSNFPLFVRRYPQDSALTAFEIFLGKPALLVEHHGYFRQGYAGMSQVADELSDSQSKLKWANLEAICCEACLMRRSQKGEIHIRFYTNRFRVQNNSNRPGKYLLFRRNSLKNPAIAVKVNGRSSEFDIGTDLISIPLMLQPGETGEIRVENRKSSAGLRTGQASSHGGFKILLRRTLSEFRDNYVDTNSFLAKGFSLARRLRKNRQSTIRPA